jgi:hypothetical protein
MHMAKKPKKRRVTGGVDTHKDTHHAAVMLMNGRRLADAQFPATAQGYADLLGWSHTFGRCMPSGWRAPDPTARLWPATCAGRV